MENKTLAGLGEYLRSEREKRNITVEQVASATKINIKLLHALESDNYDALPAKPFVRGFVSSYVRYVGLDHREILARFEPYLEEKSSVKFKRPADAPHIFVEKDSQSDNSKTALTVVMVGFLVVAVIVFAVVKPSLKHRNKHKDRAAVTNEEVVTVVPPPSEGAPAVVVAAREKDKETPKATPTPSPSPTAAASPKPAATPTATAVTPAPGKVPPIPDSEVKHRLTVKALADAWVKYQVDDRPLQAYILRQDKTIYVRARNSIRFTSGNPKALEIAFDSKSFKPMDTTAKLLVVPKEAESQYKDQPFIQPNPAYLSTPSR